MYDSVANWINIPYVLETYIKLTGSGVKQYDAPQSLLCYAAGEIIRVTNDIGEEITSGTQLYISGDTLITTMDKLTFEGRKHNIQSIKTFYRDGVPNIKVVYL